MKVILYCPIIMSLMIFVTACTKSKMVLDDISRDIYESKVRKAQRIENIGDPTPIDQEYPTYDEYQRERKKLLSGNEETPSVINELVD